jgi:hypothetical protein
LITNALANKGLSLFVVFSKNCLSLWLSYLTPERPTCFSFEGFASRWNSDRRQISRCLPAFPISLPRRSFPLCVGFSLEILRIWATRA